MNFVLGDRPTLVDFETATSTPAFTQAPDPPGELEGTLTYIAPEQTGRMNRGVDRRADLYALGATFYEMLTGAPPFSARDPLELLHAHVARRAHTPAVVNASVPTAVSNIVVKLLSKMPEWRYQSADALKMDLNEARARWRSAGKIESFELGRHDVPYGLLIDGSLYGREQAEASCGAPSSASRPAARRSCSSRGPVASASRPSSTPSGSGPPTARGSRARAISSRATSPTPRSSTRSGASSARRCKAPQTGPRRCVRCSDRRSCRTRACSPSASPSCGS